MAKLFDSMKQAGQMKKEMKKIQKGLARKTVEASSGNGVVKAVARADISVESITIDEKLIKTGNVERIEKLTTAAVNAALKSAKKKAGAEMSRLTGGMGLPGMPG